MLLHYSMELGIRTATPTLYCANIKELYILQKLGNFFVTVAIKKELFTPILNRIAVSVQYVSFTPLVLHTKLSSPLHHRSTNKTIRNENGSTFSEVMTMYVHKFIIYPTKSTYFQVYRSKLPKTQLIDHN